MHLKFINITSYFCDMQHITRKYLSDLTYQINGAAIEVHKLLGPGLLESAYHTCLKIELDLRGINYISEYFIPFEYKKVSLSTMFKADLFIENCIVVELKTVEDFSPIHIAKTLNYMNLIKAPKGILYNFNVANLYAEGQKTLVNKYYEEII